jgi:hypothetical protein
VGAQIDKDAEVTVLSANRQQRTYGDEHVSEVVEAAAELVDGSVEVSEEYRRGVVELATRLCLCGDDFDDAVIVMGYAVCGVNRPGGAE